MYRENDRQSGNATLFAIAFAGIIGMIGVGLGTMQDNKLAALTMQETRMAIRLVNESAIETVAGLAANYVIVQDKHGLKVGDGIKDVKGVKNNGMWKLVNPKQVEVTTCTPHLPLADANRVYGADRDEDNRDAHCGSRGQIKTLVQVEEFTKGDHVILVAKTPTKGPNGAKMEISARGQVRVPSMNEFIDNTDTCEFMEPLRRDGSDKSFAYYPDGKIILRPRRGYADHVIPSYNEPMYSDMSAPNWQAFNAKIKQMEADGYGGLTEYTEHYDYRKTVPTEPTYHPPQSYAKFAYYLGGKNTHFATWPALGLREPRLKAGCQKTVGDSTPDFCTRVDVHVSDLVKGFTTKRDCTTSTNADGTSSTTCETKTLAKPIAAAKKENWLCMYFAFKDVMNHNVGGKKCDRQFRAYCRNGDGCFDPKTKIQMADGRLLPINQIKMGDLVMTAAGTPAPVTNIVAGPETKAMLRIGFQDKSVSVTEEHPFDTRRGLLRAKELKIYDEILTVDGTYRQLDVLEALPIDPDQMAWNVLVGGGDDPRSHMVIGDGIVSGDLYLQNRGMGSLSRQDTH